MAGVRDGQLYKAGPWPRGVNNTAEEGALPENEYGTRPIALREAVNVDLTAQGRPRRRRGYAPAMSGALAHSGWRDSALPFGLYVDGGALKAVFDDLTTQDLGVDVGNAPVSYARINDRVFFSNNSVSGLITPDLQAWSWAPECPLGQPACAAATGYSLDKGMYQVAVTFTDLLGRESGAALAVQLDVGQDGGIELSNIPQPLDPVATPTVNFYATGADDQVLRLYTSAPSMTAHGVIADRADGRPLLTQHLQPLPPGGIVRGGHGRQWVARFDQLYWSAPLRYGLFNPARDRMRFDAPIDMLEPIGDGAGGAGVFAAAGDKTYWYSGADPHGFSQVIVAHQGVVPGSSLVLPGDAVGMDTAAPVATWLGKDGVHYVGTPGGSVAALTSGVVVDSADRAAVFYREQGGVAQLVAALRGPRPQSMAVTDRAYAHIVHRDAGI
ncbi:MAG TPA: hypothetical protein PKZ27_02770 [Rhodocyclaceae bacterium]|nr:hypothetical protein [Rhodocyclaceae bacterium]